MHAPFSVWQTFYFRNTCFCKRSVTYPSPASHLTGSGTHSSWVILKDTGQHRTDSAHVAAGAGPGPTQTEFIFLTRWIRHMFKKVLPAWHSFCFYLNIMLLRKCPGKSRNKLPSEIYRCDVDFLSAACPQIPVSQIPVKKSTDRLCTNPHRFMHCWHTYSHRFV